MDWFRSKQKSSANELGDHLPEDDAQPCVESERIEAKNRDKAKEKCEDIAEAYGGTDPEVEPIGKGLFDCTFKLWR